MIVLNRQRCDRVISCIPIVAGCFFTAVLWSICTADEQISGTNRVLATPVSISSDSLRTEIQRLRREAASLRREADSLQPPDTLSENASRTVVKQPAPHKKDTVQILSSETASAFLESLNGKKRSSRERGYGGGFGPVMGVYAVDMRPVDDLLDFMRGDASFRNSGLAIDKPFTLFQFSGFCGYGAVGNGLRIGGCFLGGSRSYSAHTNDTTFTVEINPSFGGFIIEKSLIFNEINLFAGGMVGGSSITVRPTKNRSSIASIPLSADNVKPYFNEIKASSLLAEVHGGFTYTMINWFHLGADCSAPLFFSRSGFTTSAGNSVTNGFFSINPGIRIRIIIGNIG